MNRFVRAAVSRNRKRDEYFMSKKKTTWFVYIVECADGTYYTGITKDISKRISEHNSSPRGAKYTRSRRPVKLLEYLATNTRSDALKLEYKIKKQRRSDKINYIKSIKSEGEKNEHHKED